jgi:RNA polymerase primary sigma factor
MMKVERSRSTRVVAPDSLGLYLEEISRFPQLTPQEEKAVARSAREGSQDALATLIESNLRFVVSMAKKYARSGYPMHELINEGNLGLIEAARRFDPDRDVRFVTYAGWWIRQAILAAIAHYGQSFSIPPKVKHQRYRFDQRLRKLTQELGYTPTLEEISENFEMPVDEVTHMLELLPREVSLSAPVSEGSDLDVQDLIEDPNIEPLDKALIAQSFERQLEELLDQLDPREREIVGRRFGLREAEPETLADVGDSMGLSRERIRQLEVRALDKLRRSQRASQLRGYLN